MSEVPAPRVAALRQTVELLTALSVKVTDTRETSNGPGYVSEYVSYRTEQLAALCSVDIGIGARIAAALSLMPPAGAAEQAATGTLTGPLFDNYLEVVNVLTGMFDHAGHPGVRLEETYDRPSNLVRVNRARPFAPKSASFLVEASDVSGLVTFWV